MTTTKTRVKCPECGGKSQPVKPVTVQSLVIDEARDQVSKGEGFRFCASSECETVYFHPDTGTRLSKRQLRVRVGQKETTSPRPVCYCFDHTVEEIEADVAATGSSPIADSITAKCRQGLDRCEETNPQGRCCLGNVRAAVQVALTAASRDSLPDDEQPALEAHECCTPGAATSKDGPTVPAGSTPAPSEGETLDVEEPAQGKGELVATGGAVLSAVLSSACCWLPLLLVGLGLSAGSVAGALEAYRPLLLGVTGLFLATGFYLTYFRKAKCGPDGSCAVPNPRLVLFNKVMLWVATVVVAAFAFFPNYVGAFLDAGPSASPSGARTPGTFEVLEVQIEGMTCEACAVNLEAGLSKVDGVHQADVSFSEKRAVLRTDPGIDRDPILRVIERLGYRGRIEASASPAPSAEGTHETVRARVEGMTCEACAVSVRAELARLEGAAEVQVDFAGKLATVSVPRGTDPSQVLRAIERAGYRGEILQVTASE